jgi:hypothetical protein
MSINNDMRFLHIHYIALKYEQAKDAFHAKCPKATHAIKNQYQITKPFYKRPAKTYCLTLESTVTIIEVTLEEQQAIEKADRKIAKIKKQLSTNSKYSDFVLAEKALKQSIITSIEGGHTAEEITDELSHSYDKALQAKTMAKINKTARMEVKPAIAVPMPELDLMGMLI